MPTLRLGMTGDDVVSLQLALVSVGLLAGQPDGNFDTTTQQAVMQVQRRARLAQTGVVDDATWNALFQLQASVAPTSGGGVSVGPRATGTIEGEQQDIVGAVPGRGIAFVLAVVAGGVYWYTHKTKASHATDEYGADDSEEDEEDEDSFEPPGRRSLRDLSDSVTDSLIDEPAVVSSSGRASDCKKAAMLLLRRQGLVQRPAERELQKRVIGRVAQNCREHEDVLEDAIAAEKQARKEFEREVGTRLIRSAHDIAPGTSHEHGFRKTKHKLTRKTTGAERAEAGQRGRGRRGASAIDVRRGGKSVFKMRREKAKTKRGYTWRKENE